MEIIKFIIVGKDEEYGQALCKCSRNLDINVSFSYTDNVNVDFSKYSMIIFDGIEEQEISKEFKCPYCYLTAEKDKESVIPKIDKFTYAVKDENDKTGVADKNLIYEKIYIYKYKKLSNVLTALMDIFTYFTGNSMGSVFSGVNNCKVYSVISSMGGAGATSIAMGLAKDMAYAGGNKTLYLSLGEYHQELNFSKGQPGKNLREYLYDLFYGNMTYCENIHGYLVKLEENLFIFNISEVKNQFSTIDDKMFMEFINFIVKKNFFERIVVDIGTNICPKWNGLYKIANCNILMNSLTDSWYQEQFWLDFYKTTGKINDKTLMVENKINLSESEADTEENLSMDSDQQDIVSKNKSGTAKLADYFNSFNSFNSNFTYLSKEEISRIDEKKHISRKKKKKKIRIPEDRKAFIRNDGVIGINLDTEFGQGIREIVMALADLNKIN